MRIRSALDSSLRTIFGLCIVGVVGCSSPPAETSAAPDTFSPPPAQPDTQGASQRPPASKDTSVTLRPDSGPPPERMVPPPTVLRGPARIMAMGDVHGDLNATKAALRLAGAIDANDQWIGGDLIVVQVGDQLDRGDGEEAILKFLDQLAEAAHQAGGGVFPLVGNHETMNVDLNLSYVTEGGYEDFADVPFDPRDPIFTNFLPHQYGRVAAFRPGGPFAMLLAKHNTVMVIDGTVFVHGGVLPEHVAYGLDAINRETQAWMRGETPRPAISQGSNSLVWSRHYSSSPDLSDCMLLEEVLDALGARRMVVAHTVQPAGISDACQGRVWRVDVGLASYYGGTSSVLSIVGDDVQVIVASEP